MDSLKKLWAPSLRRVSAAQLTKFRLRVEGEHGLELADYAALHRWSVEHPAEFWSTVWDFCGVVGERAGPALVPAPERLGKVRWFPEARLNFAENLLRGDDARVAVIAEREGAPRTELRLGELRAQVARWRSAFRAAGVSRGERVVGWLGNGVEALAAMLGAASLGAVWSSCSPDFGARGVLDRFEALEPAVLVAIDGYGYGGKRFDLRAKLGEVLAGLPSLRATIVVPWLDAEAPLPRGARWASEVLAEAPQEPLAFERTPFDHPLYVMFSSGTTGRPKCIVHGVGGTLLQHLKEHRLQCDIRAGSRVLFHTTCGWMMWNWIVSALASEAKLVLFDGHPLSPRERLLELAAREQVEFFGVSAKYLDTLREERVRKPAGWGALRTIASTGSVLSPLSFDYVYATFGDVHLASISGGTDILSCFVGGDPTSPVWRGEIQAAGLGMDVDVFDEKGRALASGAGELVCRPPFLSMPLGLWNDPGDEAFRRAYFERFPGVWRHGDWIERTQHGGFVIRGRSDATLNVHGVRIGTAEIYATVERIDGVLEALAVESTLKGRDGLVLFVRLRSGVELDDALRRRIVDDLKQRMSPRHAPRFLFAAPDFPRTRSGKLSELAVREVLHGGAPRNIEALANPESLAFFQHLRW
jgi:acetoacetyl-CoA synthetase